MIFDDVFQRFMEKSPVPVMVRMLLERIFNPERINIWLEQTADKQYTRELFFSSSFELMNGVVFKIFPTILTAYQDKGKGKGVSVTSVYNKLNGLEANTSAALVRDAASEMAEIIETMGAKRQPWFPGFRVKVLDGNCIEATEHRLDVLRRTRAGALPGKSLNIYDPALEMIVDVIPCEDGHSQERSLLGEVLQTVQAQDVWIMDRNFWSGIFSQELPDEMLFLSVANICQCHEYLLVMRVMWIKPRLERFMSNGFRSPIRTGTSVNTVEYGFA